MQYLLSREYIEAIGVNVFDHGIDTELLAIGTTKRIDAVEVLHIVRRKISTREQAFSLIIIVFDATEQAIGILRIDGIGSNAHLVSALGSFFSAGLPKMFYRGVASLQITFQVVPQTVGFVQRSERGIRPVEFLFREKLQAIPEHDFGREHGLLALTTERRDAEAGRIGGEANVIRQIAFAVIGELLLIDLLRQTGCNERKIVDIGPSVARRSLNSHGIGKRKH